MSDESLELELPDEAATVRLGRRVAAALRDGAVIHLHGELGAGKTSLARALLGALGVGERIKSPTYSLIESYPLPDGGTAWHLDLYRIADPGELEWLGLDALAEPGALVLVEWPERGRGSLPAAELDVYLAHSGEGRRAILRGVGGRGPGLLQRLQSAATA